MADLADYGPAKGTVIIKPYGYAIWEFIQQALDERIKAKGVGNAYFPLLIPMSFLEKEKSHVKGFKPELAVVTHGGGEKLEEPLAIRPTSETIMYNSFSQWIQSWRDLPLLMNQWNNVVRWEKRTMPFIRTSEFLWQEGHTAHATHEEALEMQRWAMDMYIQVYQDFLAIAGYSGYKSQSERFAGAETTLTFESLMPSGKSLQSCTSHDLAQHFSKAFSIRFQNQQRQEDFVWQTSWGFSTRSLGALIMAHGDDNGLRLPPKVAPIQVVIVPTRIEPETLAYCQAIRQELKESSIRVRLDDRDNERFGYKINEWEVRGVPIILKLGPREVAADHVSWHRRDTLEDGQSNRRGLGQTILKLLETIQRDMLAATAAYRDSNTREAKTYDEFKRLIEKHKGFIKVCWNDNPGIEKKIKDETKATSCCLISENGEGVDFYTGEPAKDVWLFAQSY